MLDTDERRPVLLATIDAIDALIVNLDELLATHDTDEPETRWDDADDAIDAARSALRSARDEASDAVRS